MINVNELRTRVNEKLWEREPSELIDILWNPWNRFNTTQGPWGTKYLVEDGRFTQQVVDLFQTNNLLEEFQDYYYDWFSYTQHELMENEEEIKSIQDEEERYEVSFESVDSDGFTYNGFINYLIYLTQEVVDELMEVEITKYSEILIKNGVENEWEWRTDDYGRILDSRILEIKGELEWEDEEVDDFVEYIVEMDLSNQNFEIFHSEDWCISSDTKTYNYQFKSFDEFIQKLIDLKKGLDKKNEE
jgi:hypothetical protein